jgi:hypothetical protein
MLHCVILGNVTLHYFILCMLFNVMLYCCCCSNGLDPVGRETDSTFCYESAYPIYSHSLYSLFISTAAKLRISSSSSLSLSMYLHAATLRQKGLLNQNALFRCDIRVLNTDRVENIGV